MAAKFDILTPKDDFTAVVGACREGTNVTAVRADDEDGPVRPTFQALYNCSWWLKVGVVNASRTLAAVHISKAGGGLPSSAAAGNLLVEGAGRILGDLAVDGDITAAGSIRAGTFISAKLFGQAGLLWQTGITGGPTVSVLQDSIAWGNVKLGGANPPRGAVVRNTLYAKTLCKVWGEVEIQGGSIVVKEGAGGWDASLRAPGGPEPFRLDIQLDKGEAFDTAAYCILTGFGCPPGTFGLISVKEVEKRPDFFSLAVWNTSPAAPPHPVDLSKVSSCKIYFGLKGAQS